MAMNPLFLDSFRFHRTWGPAAWFTLWLLSAKPFNMIVYSL
jgi:hypothetical protein